MNVLGLISGLGAGKGNLMDCTSLGLLCGHKTQGCHESSQGEEAVDKYCMKGGEGWQSGVGVTEGQDFQLAVP